MIILAAAGFEALFDRDHCSRTLHVSNFQVPPQAYVRSGIVPISGAFWCLTLSALIIPVLAFFYALVIEWIPLIYVSVVATLVYGFVAGLVVGVLWKMNNIRSLLFYRFAFLLFFVYAMYLYWAMSIWAKDGFAHGLTVFDPEVILAFGRRLFDEGSWGFSKNAPVKGWFLVAFWIAEALLIASVMYFVITSDADQPFCESCQQWTETEKGVAMFHATGREPEWDRLRSGDYSALTQLPILMSKQPEYVRVDVATCPKCSASNFLTVQHVKVKKDDEGGETKTETNLLTNIVLRGDHLQLVRELVDRAVEAEAARTLSANPAGGQADVIEAEELPPGD